LRNRIAPLRAQLELERFFHGECRLNAGVRSGSRRQREDALATHQ
jgi:hypothetical protein